MTEIKLTLDAPASWVAALRSLHDQIGAGSSPLSEPADQIEGQIPKPAIEEPTELWSVIFANVPGSQMLEPKQLVKMDGWWSDSEGNGWGDFAGFSDVEVLRMGVGEPRPFTEEEIDQQQAEANRILHNLNSVAAGEIVPPDPDESRFWEAQPSEAHQDHVSLAVVLRILDEVRTASITATEQEAVRRCHRALMVLPTYAGCRP